ncbi:carbohydrate kinase family protein [Cognatishimia sp. F0-27]|uniref:carbohydrate kinase family protein n=1 Tax=Cognatishimia sp. F0-27 TaxID=2816855 RepID=UPI001D0C995D|nr:PfkB family carbohydrate kinase [Cognatishimia sp. F0-27]MCC1494421.1 carbohydrate kinase [Cognatishimia sp. F0-27]
MAPVGGNSGGAAVLCAGRLYCDLVFTDLPSMPRMGRETFAGGLSLHAGGGAYITAACLAALGHQAGLLATLPAAPFGDLVRNEIEAMNVATQWLTAACAGAPQITVAMAHGGDRAFLSHKSGPALQIPPRGLEGPWRHLHIGELRTLVEHPGLVGRAHDAAMSVSLDCGHDDALLCDGAALVGLIGSVDVFLPNAQEYVALCASGLPESAAPLVVVKDGAAGARAMEDGRAVSVAAEPACVVDATGAGDAFNGGFLSAWLAGAPLEAALRLGNHCGAAAVAAPGGAMGFDSLRRAAV